LPFLYSQEGFDMSSNTSSPPVPGSIRERAEALCELVREEASASERLGRLTDKVVGALLQAGLFSILLPESAGGLGGTRLDFFEAAEALGRADGSTGWCITLCNSVNFVVWRGLGVEGRGEVFGQGPVACWTRLIPDAVSTTTLGGYRVSGKWTYGSGSSFARWVAVTSVSKDADGRNVYRGYLVPKEDVELMDGSWDTLGLRATYSVDYAIADKFVPAHRTYEFFSEGLAASGPISAMESVWLNQVGLTAFASGVGQRALSELIAAAPKTKRTAAAGFQAEDHIVQSGVAELEGRLGAARSHYRELVTRQDEIVARGEPAGPALRAELTLAAQTLTRAVRDTALFAYDHSGTSVVYTSSPIQRCLRDLLTGLKHAGFTPSILARIGRVRLGLPPLPLAL
jgi:alkylation response protein AidB-like acyl-CoA dehydrogenase